MRGVQSSQNLMCQYMIPVVKGLRIGPKTPAAIHNNPLEVLLGTAPPQTNPSAPHPIAQRISNRAYKMIICRMDLVGSNVLGLRIKHRPKRHDLAHIGTRLRLRAHARTLQT